MVLRVPDIPVPVVPAGDPSTVEFSIASAGRYNVQVIVDAATTCALERSLVVAEPERNVLVFSVSPPDSFIGPIPAQRLRLPVKAASTATISLDLKTGTPVRILPQDAGQNTVPSFVRVRALSGASTVDGYTDRGPVSTVLLPWPGETYEVLVVPDSRNAPQLFGTPDLLPGADHLVRLPMNPGVAITGTATDASGAGVPDTRVILHAGTRPSTVGTSDASGAFSLLSRPGVHSAVLSPPLGSGLPEVHIPVAPGIAVSPADATLALNLTWARFAMVPVTLHIRSSDGASDVAGAQVWLESSAELANVATVEVSGGAAGASTVMASGAVRATAITDAAGIASFAAVPAGAYALTIVPSLGMPATRTALVAPPEGLSTTIPLDSPVALAGLVLPAGQTGGMRVLARDQGSGVAATTLFTATVDSAGRYRMMVAPRAIYQLEVDPQGVAGYARAVIGNVAVAAQDQMVPDLVLSPGRAFNGVVSSAAAAFSGAPSVMAGAVVRVFCPSSSATCPAPDLPVAEAVTRSDGTFRLVLPRALVE